MVILDIKNLNKVFDNGKQALKNLSFSIEQGEFIALLGVNGAGKSTMINILGNIVKKTSGTVLIGGHDIDKNRIMANKQIGIVHQEVSFDPFFTPYETLKIQQGMYGVPFNKNAIYSLLEDLELKEKAHSSARSLSGGMKRRLLIAKALVHNPKIVFLDEPTAGVDIGLRKRIWSLMKKLHTNGTTVILTTHYLEEAQQLCNKVAIIHNGELIKYEPTEALLDTVGSKLLQLICDNITTENIAFLETIKQKIQYNIEDNHTINIKYKESSIVPIIISNLNHSGLNIQEVKLANRSLEEIFLELTK